jgi:hypothetical protein
MGSKKLASFLRKLEQALMLGYKPKIFKRHTTVFLDDLVPQILLTAWIIS